MKISCGNSNVEITTDDNIFNFIVRSLEFNKLSAYILHQTDQPTKYSYTVIGKTSDVDFTYSTDVYSSSHQISVIGLYANTVTQVNLILESEDGQQEIVYFSFDTSSQDFSDVLTSVSFDITDEEMMNNTLGQGWLITCFMNGYDKNGDLRLCGPYPWLTNNMKTIDNLCFYGNYSGEREHQYHTNIMYSGNLMGHIKTTFTAPDKYAFHHDITTDNKGNLYILGSLWADEPPEGTPEERQEGIIYKYDINTGELLWQRDHSREFDGMMVLMNSPVSDIHYNSLEYIEDYNQIITSSRNSSAVIGFDAETGDLIWVLQDPSFPVLPAKNIEIINSDGFVYPNGQHAVFLTYHEKYSSYWDEGKTVIVIFDNRSCAFEDGTPNMREIDSPVPDTYEAYPFDSRVYVMAIDLENYTAELLDTFSVSGERTEFAGVAFELNGYFQLTMSDIFKFFILDTNNNVGVACHELDTKQVYRSRIYTYDELRSLI